MGYAYVYKNQNKVVGENDTRMMHRPHERNQTAGLTATAHYVM